MNHKSKHRFIPIGGAKSGHKKWADSKYGYYYLSDTAKIHRATRTEVKDRLKFGKEFVALRTHWLPTEITLKYNRNHSYLIGEDNIYYIKIGQMIIGKLAISLWYSFFGKGRKKTEIDYRFYKKLDYRRYKAANHMKHNYHNYKNATGEYDYQQAKDSNRSRVNYNRRKTL